MVHCYLCVVMFSFLFLSYFMISFHFAYVSDILKLFFYVSVASSFYCYVCCWTPSVLVFNISMSVCIGEDTLLSVIVPYTTPSPHPYFDMNFVSRLCKTYLPFSMPPLLTFHQVSSFSKTVSHIPQ